MTTKRNVDYEGKNIDYEESKNKMLEQIKLRKAYDSNIEKILHNSTGEWTSLYTHPKLMGNYFWKDGDTVHTR